MQYKQTVTISKTDLKKLMRINKIQSLRQLAMMADIDYTYLIKCYNDKLTMSQKTWDKLKVCLDPYPTPEELEREKNDFETLQDLLS